MTVDYQEMDGSPVEQWTADGFRATEVLMCDWDNRSLAVMEIYGRAYPRISWTRSYALDINVERFNGQCSPLGGDTAVADYEKAILTIQYSGPMTEDWISESLEPNAEFMTLDHEDFCWDSKTGDPLLEAEAPGRLVRSLDYVLTMHNVRALPLTILTLVGTVNASPVTAFTLGLTFPPETLLYNPPTCTRRILTTEVEAWKVTFRFTYKPEGWNTFWRTKTQEYESIYHRTEGEYKNFPTANFTALMTGLLG